MEHDRTSRRHSGSSFSAVDVASESPSAPSSIRRRYSPCILWITYLNVLLYSLCYRLQQPVEPFLLQKLLLTSNNDNDDESVALIYRSLQALFFALQTIGAPLVGILLDQSGIRITSAVVFLACVLSYSLLALATTLPVLVCSKLPSAFQAGFLVAQATATTRNDNEGSRALTLGRMSSAYLLGAAVGPALGGYLAGLGDLYLSARLAAVGSMLSVVLSLLYLPNHTTTKQSVEENESEGFSGNEASSKASLTRPSFGQHVQRLGAVAARPVLLPLFITKILGGVSASMHSTVLPLVLSQHLQFDPQTLGLVMSSGMLGAATFSAFGVKPLADLMGASGMARCGVLARSFLTFVLAFMLTTFSLHLGVPEQERSYAPQVYHVVIVATVLHRVASHALATGLTTQTTGAVDPEQEQGALLGLEHSLFGLARIGGPPLGIFLLSWFGSFWAVAIACALIDVVLWGVLIFSPLLQYISG